MSAAHTPGPWAIRDGYGLLKAEVGPSGRAVATVWTKQMPNGKEDQKEPLAWAEGEANAALIAAAPELLEALQSVMNYPEVRSYLGSLISEQADAAIAKAGGAS